jgi:hypothetical protein
MFIKPRLKYICSFVSIDSLVPEKSDDHSLVILRLKRSGHRLQNTKRENNYALSRTFEINLIHLAFPTFYALGPNFHETRATDLSK